MAMAAECKTNFAGFRIPEAAALYAVAAPMPEAKQQVAESLIAVVRGKAIDHIQKHAPEHERKHVEQVAGDSFDLLTKIVKSGRIDATVTGLLGEDSATGLGAFYVADGKLFDKVVHGAVKHIETEHPEVAQFVQLDAANVNGLNIHKVSIPIPDNAENRENVVKFIGEKLEVVIAVGEENVYVAAGRDAAEKLKAAVRTSKEAGTKTVAPVKFSYAAQPFAAAVAAVGTGQEQAAGKMIVAELKKTPGKDHVTFTVRPIDNGVRMRLEVEPGLLRLAGRIVVMRMEGKSPSVEGSGN
jgi:hypothetical protein